MKNKTQIIILLDRSGSMASIANDMTGAFKNFINNQKNNKEECYISIWQFDTTLEQVLQNTNIQDYSGDLILEPGGMTALYDSLANVINIEGKNLANLNESDRPDKVIFVSITDGEENSSIEFSQSQVKSMIEHQTNVYSWQFIFLGAGIDVRKNSYNVGTSAKTSYHATPVGVRNMFEALGSGICYSRSASIDHYHEVAKSGKLFEKLKIENHIV